jgi:AraC-like DNA-binding protein
VKERKFLTRSPHAAPARRSTNRNGAARSRAARNGGASHPELMNENIPALQGWVRPAPLENPAGTAKNDQTHLQTVTPARVATASPAADDRVCDSPLPLLCHSGRCPLERLPEDPPPSACLARILDLPKRAERVKFSRPAVAKDYGFSTRTLERTIKRALSSTPSQCLECLGMRRAPKLLAGRMNVNEAADFLGYGGHTQFSRKFKRWYGCSPKKWSARATGALSIKVSPKVAK